jgi:hypothetical protein
VLPSWAPTPPEDPSEDPSAVVASTPASVPPEEPPLEEPELDEVELDEPDELEEPDEVEEFEELDPDEPELVVLEPPPSSAPPSVDPSTTFDGVLFELPHPMATAIEPNRTLPRSLMGPSSKGWLPPLVR